MAMTNQQFITVKTLQEAGSSSQEIATYLKLGHKAVCVAYRSETYDEYKNECTAIAMRAKAKKKEEPVEAKTKQPEEPAQPKIVEHRQTITIQATHYMMEEMKDMKELLKVISAKLAFIVEDLCPDKMHQ